ncbi:proteasome subunit beta type-3, putative [Entamoeba dispar SAW760]|uniref:Proteasome subunit beta n=1 Tax=Entamoeba dispar (strain ATCC PRA-260 / SAW760) TaxID=370354 RepID=B0ER51_ENTDS|nr:proteasome subunit beta type-3, putative [Entamoeba dispar SAW760]EDR23004.1 proteasome subunit beta type-3, putative [Entamoeba dispar SAW760]|eukprot:EDR23004.1 proteasome subunit beta type-3, putative [Entamoeba dispar SAW760]
MGDDITYYSGGAVVGMAGKGCVAIAADNRYGLKYQFASANFHKVFQVNKYCLFGGAGLFSDVQTMAEKVKYHANLYRLREGHDIGPEQLLNSTAHMLYKKRFQPYYMSPIIAGIDDNGNSYVCSYDYIGSPEISRVGCVGTGSNELMGMCDSFYKEGMEPEELVEAVGQCLLAAENRDAFSGWGVEVYLLTRDNLTIYNMKPRQD